MTPAEEIDTGWVLCRERRHTEPLRRKLSLFLKVRASGSKTSGAPASRL